MIIYVTINNLQRKVNIDTKTKVTKRVNVSTRD